MTEARRTLIDNTGENSTGGAFGQAGDTGRLTALELSMEQCLLEEASGFRFQRVASIYIANQTDIQVFEIEEFRHEGYLVHANLQEPERKVDKRPMGAAVEGCSLAPSAALAAESSTLKSAIVSGAFASRAGSIREGTPCV